MTANPGGGVVGVDGGREATRSFSSTLIWAAIAFPSIFLSLIFSRIDVDGGVDVLLDDDVDVLLFVVEVILVLLLVLLPTGCTIKDDSGDVDDDVNVDASQVVVVVAMITTAAAAAANLMFLIFLVLQYWAYDMKVEAVLWIY